MNNKQVFHSDSPSRWNKFKWSSRVVLAVIVLTVVSVIITISSKKYPKLPDLNHVPSISKNDLEKIKQSSKYKEFKIQKAELLALDRDKMKHKKVHPNENKKRLNVGFFVGWDPQSYNSLNDHISKLDMVVPEFFFLKPGTDSLVSTIDTAVVNLVKKHQKKLIASVKNYTDQGWDGKAVHYMISTGARRTNFINQLVKQLQVYKLDGVNIDFEDLVENSDESLIAFQKQLYQTLHSKGFIVTQDVSPDNADYNVEVLQKYNDYLFLMAYDQHTELSNPGDIAHQKWVEKQLDLFCRKVSSEKIILCIAGYGFDWPKNGVGRSITYEQAISTAQQNHSKVVFDPGSANLHYIYYDSKNVEHTVYFTDAASNFNIMRMVDDWETGGVALWRLGSEDPRLWKFIGQDLSIDTLRKVGFDTKLLTNIELMNRVDYIGDGEILDLVSAPTNGKLAVKLDPKSQTIVDQQYIELPTRYVIKRFGQAEKKVILTFDDGPDPVYTPQILDILKKEKVPGSFFVVGLMVEQNIPILKQIFDEGYEIGNHTFFHPDLSKVSHIRVNFELNATRKLIECVTGRSTILFRPPFNADAEPQTEEEVVPVLQSRKENYINVGNTIDPRDWEKDITADSVFNRVVRQQDNGSIILLHDAGGDRSATVEALPRIIDFYKKKGYQFTTIADILGKTKAEIMPEITNDSDGLVSTANAIFVEALFYGGKFLFYIFTIAIILALMRVLVVGYLALTKYYQEKHAKPIVKKDLPAVSILIPAYNEEVTAVQTINSLLKINYPIFEILFVDDGSSDRTIELVQNAFSNHPRVRVLTKMNGGKASALNLGVAESNYEYLVCIDADTQLHPDAIVNLLACFDDEVGAVAGTVKVGNEVNLLTKWQSIEYITSQNMDRRAFDVLNSITVVPGAIGVFRKDAIEYVGGFTSDTLAEDCDLTMRVLKAGYVVKNCSTSIAYTEAPETLNMFLKQRFRWSFGVIQSFWKNRDALFRKEYGYFGMIGMPNILIFQIILPLFAPLADLFMLAAVIGEAVSLISADSFNLSTIHSSFSLDTSFGQVVAYYILFVIVDILFAMLAFKLEKESYKKLVYIIPQRFLWRQLMYYVLFKAIRNALKGEIGGWGTLKRTGNVKGAVVPEQIEA